MSQAPPGEVVGPFALIPAAYVYLLREGVAGTEVLLQQRGEVPYMAGHWAAGAAGHVEPGEDAFTAATRELREELDISADLAFEFAMQRTQHGPAIEERVDFFFTAREWAGTPRIVEPAKCAPQPTGAARSARAGPSGRFDALPDLRVLSRRR